MHSVLYFGDVVLTDPSQLLHVRLRQLGFLAGTAKVGTEQRAQFLQRFISSPGRARLAIVTSLPCASGSSGPTPGASDKGMPPKGSVLLTWARGRVHDGRGAKR